MSNSSGNWGCLVWRSKGSGMTSLLYNHLKGDCSEVGVSLLCHVSVDRMTANGFKCPREGSDYILEKKKNHWKSHQALEYIVQGGGVVTISADICVWYLGVCFGVIIVVCWVDSWLDDLEGLFQSWWFCDSGVLALCYFFQHGDVI